MIQLTEEDDEFFSKMERDQQIREILLKDFDELTFTWLKDDYIRWLGYNTDMVIRLIEEEPASDLREIMPNRFEKLRLYFANYLASSTAAYEFLFNYGKKKFQEGLQNKFNEIAKQLKETPCCRFLNELRNRQLHGGSIFGTLGSYRSFVAQKERFYPVLTKSAMDDLRNSNHTNDYIFLLDKIDKALNAQQDWLLPILKCNKETVENAFRNADSAFSAVYATEIAEQAELENELHEIEEWFNQKGHSIL